MPLSEKSPDPVASTSASAASGLPAPAPAAAKKGKRKADKDKDEEGSHSGTGTPTQKRSRVHFSCVECNRRKQKCDRQSPCGHCLARKIPHLCRPFINGVEDPAVVEADVRARLDRIENLLSGLVSETRNGGTTSSSGDVKRLRVLSSPLPILKLGAGDSPDDPMRNGGETTGDEGGDEDDEDGPTGTLRGGRFYGPSAMSSVSSSRMSRILSSFPSNTFGAPPPNQLPSSSSRQRANHRAASPYALQGQPLPPPLEDALNTLDESGIGLDNIVALMNKLPAREMREALVGLYWREIDWTRYHIYQPAFQSRYMAFFAHETSGNPVHTNIPYPIRSLEANGLKWLPLLFIMMAIATLTAPLSLFGDEETRRVWSRSLYGSARKAMNIAQALQRDNLDIVMAGLLIGRYLLLVRRAAEGFTPLTTALQLGLYRDGTHLGIEDAREVELRRRVWSSVYHHDRSQSLLVGRPCLISDSSCDTKPPANLEDLDLDLISEFPPGGRPMSQPTTMTYTVLRHSLAVIMGKISQRIFSLSHPSYNTVVEIDQELIEWKHNLPSYFKLENPDRSMDAKYHFLAFHRQILAAEFYATRITLHRPYMLRKRDSQLYEYSRKAAVEAARADLTSRRDFQLNKPAHLNYRLSLGSYWLLNSYIIIGIALLLDPTSTQADELRNLLNVVTGRAPDQDGRVSMATVRELAIVELFTHRRSHDDPISAPGSPTSSMSALPRQSNAPYLPSFAGQRSIINQDFLSPNATSVANQPLEPGLWGQVDPVDQLLLSYHRQRDALNANTAAQHAAAVQQQQPPQQQAPVDSAWSARAVGMGDHSVQRPFSDAGGEDDGASSNGGNGPPPPRVDDRGTYLAPQGGSQYGGARDGGGRGPLSGGEPHGTGVYPGGNNGPNDFTTPWSHGYQAFSSAGGGNGFGSEEGGVGELLGDAKEVAFLNSLISAISSGDGPMAA